MDLHINSLNPFKWRFIRYSNGDTFHSVGRLSTNFGDQSDKMKLTLENYALFTCLKITSDICSKVKFYVKTGDGKDDFTQDDPLVKLLNRPNYLQSKEDFIKEYVWMKLTYGWAVLRPQLVSGAVRTADNTSALYALNSAHIKYPKNFKTPRLFTESDIKAFREQELLYKVGNDESRFMIDELMFFFDLANGLTQDFFLKAPSRLDAVKHAIGNMGIALNAENVMLHTNGREKFSSGQGKGANTGTTQLTMSKGDKKEIQRKLNHKIGMGFGQDRAMITDRAIDWESLHIPLKELGLYDSEQKNAGTIRNVFNIPETIFKLYLEKGDTFENKKEGEIELIQNVAQPHMDDLAKTLTDFYGQEGRPLVARFDHLDTMQHTEQKKADKLLKISAAIRNLTQAGLSIQQVEQYIQSVGITEITNDGQD